MSAKRHHTVSRFYLAHFANDAGQITTVETPGARTYSQNVANATVQSHFYTAVDIHGEPTDKAEQSFGILEGAAADAWRAVVDGNWPLTGDLRTAMAGWIALQVLRGPNVRKSLAEVKNSHLNLNAVLGGRALVREALEQSGRRVDDQSVNEAWIEFFTDPPPIPSVSANEHLRYMGQALPEILDLLLDRVWFLSVYKRKGLATCDHPVFVIPNTDFAQMGLGTGIANAREIHVPLTRRHALTMALRDALPLELASSGDVIQPGVSKTALYSNSCMTLSARKALFHHPDDRPFQGLELQPRRQQEVELTTDLWSWMKPDDRQVLLDAGLKPPPPQPKSSSMIIQPR